MGVARNDRSSIVRNSSIQRYLLVRTWRPWGALAIIILRVTIHGIQCSLRNNGTRLFSIPEKVSASSSFHVASQRSHFSFSVSILFFFACELAVIDRAAEKLTVLFSLQCIRRARKWYCCRYQILTELNFHLTEYHCERFTTPFNVNLIASTRLNADENSQIRSLSRMLTLFARATA